MRQEKVYQEILQGVQESNPAWHGNDILIGIPFSYSIADGLAWGFISYPFIKLLSGRGREASWLAYLLAVLFIARYLLIQL